MNEATELTVVIKGEDATYKQKFLLQSLYTICSHDPVVKQCIDEAIANSKIVPEDISVRILLVVQ